MPYSCDNRADRITEAGMTTFPLRLLGRVSPKALAVSTGACPACGSTVFVRFADDEIAVRCLRCRGTPVHLAVVHAVRSNLEGAPAELDAYEMSSRGPLLSWLRRTFRHVTCSEFMPEVPPGEVAGGIRSEDVQKLTDQAVKDVDAVVRDKEKELMAV